MRKRLSGEAGFTFVEMVLALLLLAIAFPFLAQLFAGMTVTGAQVATLPTASSLGASLMEEVKGLPFDEQDTKNGSGNWSTALGTNAGENAADKATFDDVDDFDGWAQGFGANFPNYTASVSVDYVAANNLNNPLTIPAPTPNNWTPSYKYIVVTMTHASLPDTIQIATVVTEAQSL